MLRVCMCSAVAAHRELQGVAGRKVDEQQPGARVQRQVALQRKGRQVNPAAGASDGQQAMVPLLWQSP